MKWRHYPLSRIFIAFVVGVLVAVLFPNAFAPPFWALLVLLGGCLFFVFYRKTTFQYRYEWLFGVLIFSLFMLFGWKRAHEKLHFIDNDHFSQIPNITAYIGYIEEEASEKARSWKSTVRIQRVCSDNEWVTAKGRLLCYFPKDSINPLPPSGTMILFYTQPDPIPPLLNPYAFDYRSYLQRRGIEHRVYLAPDRWTAIEGKAPFGLLRMSLSLRSKLLKILEDSPLTPSEFGVVSAILLGYNDKLDSEQRASYANAGAAHILSVSGMHVGVIFIFFSTLLSFLEKKKRGRVVRCVLLLLLIWSYALITGLALSVFRVAIMLSFVVVAQTLGRRKNKWNSIISSALFLLLINPLSFLELGFQLSYSAVIAIMIFQKPLYDLVQVSTWLGDKIWALITVAIAVQLGIAPVALYYFNQFPTWFLLTNLIVMPVTPFVIYTGMAVMFFSSFATLKYLFGWLLLWEVRFLNNAVQWINELPYSLVVSINITLPETLLLIFTIIATATFVMKKYKPALTIALISILLLSINIVAERITHNNQKELVVFEAGRSPVLGFVHGRNMVIVTDTIFEKNETSRSFVIDEYILRKGIKNVNFETTDNGSFYNNEVGLYRNKNAFFFNNDKIFVVNRHPEHQPETPLECDYLIVRNSYYGTPADYLAPFQCTGTIIVDGSNSRKTQQQWRTANDSLTLPIHFLSEQGAWIKRY
ncbi:MAG: ComEC family competence protein [Bacteroidales bacterium]|nr:ComEC family competence protein [Bacteroidales bacterium]